MLGPCICLQAPELTPEPFVQLVAHTTSPGTYADLNNLQTRNVVMKALPHDRVLYNHCSIKKEAGKKT